MPVSRRKHATIPLKYPLKAQYCHHATHRLQNQQLLGVLQLWWRQRGHPSGSGDRASVSRLNVRYQPAEGLLARRPGRTLAQNNVRFLFQGQIPFCVKISKPILERLN